MKKFTLTKQLLSAALIVALGFSGCQKNEIESVEETMRASSSKQIADACGVSQHFELRRINNDEAIIGWAEINNTKDYLVINFKTTESTILQVQAVVNGEEITLNNKGKNANNITELAIRVPKTDYYLIENLGMKAGTMGDQSNKIVEVGTETIIPRGEFFTIWNWAPCGIPDCGHGLGYWKNLAVANWPAIGSLTIGTGTYSPTELQGILNTDSRRTAMNLAKAIIVASLNVAEIGDASDELSMELQYAIDEGLAQLQGINIESGTDLNKINPGLIGRLHQQPACD